jgi:Fe-S-cluster containining protein
MSLIEEFMKAEACSCHAGCAACCIAPSISSPIPGMPEGKPAGMRCCQLTRDNRCALFGRQERPAVCASLQPSKQMCGASTAEAMAFLVWLEQETAAATVQHSDEGG